jgi:hypothetical protein
VVGLVGGWVIDWWVGVRTCVRACGWSGGRAGASGGWLGGRASGRGGRVYVCGSGLWDRAGVRAARPVDGRPGLEGASHRGASIAHRDADASATDPPEGRRGLRRCLRGGGGGGPARPRARAMACAGRVSPPPPTTTFYSRTPTCWQAPTDTVVPSHSAGAGTSWERQRSAPRTPRRSRRTTSSSTPSRSGDGIKPLSPPPPPPHQQSFTPPQTPPRANLDARTRPRAHPRPRASCVPSPRGVSLSRASRLEAGPGVTRGDCRTIPDGYNMGRKYFMKAANADSCQKARRGDGSILL